MHRTYPPNYKPPIGQHIYRHIIKAPVRLRPHLHRVYPPWFHFGVYQFIMSRPSGSRWYHGWMQRRGFWRDPDTGKFRRD